MELFSLRKDFWDNPNNAREVLQKKQRLPTRWTGGKINHKITDIENLWALALQERDEIVMQDIVAEIEGFEEEARRIENDAL